MKLFYGIILFSITFKASDALQRFSEQPKYTEVNPKQDALLICKVIDRKGTCSWQKDGKPVGMYPQKYEWAVSNTGMSHSGDCSVWIREVALEFDDGFWECQVTASDFTAQDALTSQPVRLVVRVAPQRPKLEHEGQHVLPGKNLTVDSGATATVKCISHYGNPPAVLKWFLGDQEIAPLHSQQNSTETDNPRTWSASSVVQVPATKQRHGKILKCLAFHEYYSARTVGVEARMDVRYAPTIKLLGSPQIDLEEGKDSLVLRCEADANPPASIVWRRAGRSEIASLTESLELRPVGRRDSGLYTCQAQNSVGSSDALTVQLDIKYPPRILSAGPDRLTTATLFTPAALQCLAEGNPSPTFKWVQRIPSQGNMWLERGKDSKLLIENVTYDYQGEYECRVSNFINAQERSTTSDPISLQVIGAPQVLSPPNSSSYHVSVKRGESASLTLVVCADPRPRHVAWEWGSLRIEAGSGVGRFRVDEVTKDLREDCYLATLHINQADIQDSRPYYLVVENERGADRHSITLIVEDLFPKNLELSYLLGITVGCLTALLMLMCFCIYASRAKKFCFKNRNYVNAEKDSEKADLKLRNESLIGVPHLDSIYTTSTGFHQHYPSQNISSDVRQGSSEAMKTLQTGNYATIFQNHHDANLVLNALRHQRDLFSGGPTLGTHVGNVIHAFENLAYQRQFQEGAEKPYESSKSSVASKKESIYKIILPPPPPKASNLSSSIISKPIVRHRPKGKAPDVPQQSRSSAAAKLQSEEIESSALDSLNLDDGFYQKTDFPQTYARSVKVLPPFENVPFSIPIEAEQHRMSSQQSIARHQSQAINRTNVFLKHKKYSENDVENDFLRGSTISQSFIRKSPERTISTYEQNFLMTGDHSHSKWKPKKKILDTFREKRSRLSAENPQKSILLEKEKPLIDEVKTRYTEYNQSSRIKNARQNFQPSSPDRAEL